ncbi:MAG: hypothetical protein Q9179_005929 [Wetmoreana sp. 5 TL-2023]
MPGAFNEEVNRAIFGTRIFAFDGDYRPNHMRPEVLARRLKGVITRRNRAQDTITLTIRALAEWLVKCGKSADVGKQNTALDYQNTLCDAAAYHIRPWILRELLKTTFQSKDCAADPSAINKLAAATAVGNLDQVQKLLSEGIDPNTESEFFGYPIQQAALMNQLDIATLLLHHIFEKVSNPDASQSRQANAFAAALAAGSSAGHNEMVQHIRSSSSNIIPALTQQHHASILSSAARNGHTNILRCLFLWQERLTSLDNTRAGQFKTNAFFIASSNGYPDVIEMLHSEHGISANVTNHEGRNSLHMAAAGGHARVVSLLLKLGTKYYASRWGDPLYLAAKNGHEEAARILLDAGADVEADGGNDNIVCACASNGEGYMLRTLLSRGLVLDHLEGRGDRALELAAEHGHVEMVKLLVGLGVDVDGRMGKDGPMLRALIHGQQEVVHALKGLGAKHVDVKETEYAANFEEGELPLKWNP